MKTSNNLQIADKHEVQGDKILQHKQGGRLEELAHFGGLVLYTGYTVTGDVSGERKVVEAHQRSYRKGPRE